MYKKPGILLAFCLDHHLIIINQQTHPIRLMKRTPPGPRRLKLLHRLLQSPPPLPLKILRPNIRNIVSLRIILRAIIARHGPPKEPSKPCDGPPAVPDGRFHVVRGGVPVCDEDAVVFVRVGGERGVAEEIRTGRGEVAKHEATDGEDGGE